MIKFDNVNKVYPNGLHALKNINLEIQQGEFVAIIGLSGAGKSTLLRTVNRMHDITDGVLTVNGQEVNNVNGQEMRKFRRKIGMVFQSFNLVTRTSVVKNVLTSRVPDIPLWKSIIGLYSKEDKVIALEALDKVGILDKPIDFLTESKCWRAVWYIMNRWKETGWGTIIYLAALSGISPDLYEAAEIDGANRLQQIWNITIPAIMNTILVVFILNLAKVMNVFESVFVLYNSLVYDVSDVIQTYTYRVGIVGNDYGYSTAIGLFKSVISLILVTASDVISKKVRGYGIV